MTDDEKFAADMKAGSAILMDAVQDAVRKGIAPKAMAVAALQAAVSYAQMHNNGRAWLDEWVDATFEAGREAMGRTSEAPDAP